MSAPPEWVFFTDRDLGAYIFPDHLKNAGQRVERHVDYFVDDAHDEDWLPEVARRGWVILTSDQRMMRRPVERDAVMVSGARLLILIGANAQAEELAVNFVNTRARLESFLAQHASPYIAKVYRPSHGPAVLGAEPGRVEVKLTYQEWLHRFVNDASDAAPESG
jgi:hypothetical protein